MNEVQAIRLLQSIYADDPAEAPPGLLDRVRGEVGRRSQRRSRALCGRWWTRDGGPMGQRVPALAVASLVVVGAVVLAQIGLLRLPTGPGTTATPVATASPSPTIVPASPTLGESELGAKADAYDLVTGITVSGSTPALHWLTSSTFGRPIYFWLLPFGDGAMLDNPVRSDWSDWCDAETGDRWIGLPYLMGCVVNLRILRPDDVACAPAPAIPTADDLADAILALEAVNAVDAGPIASAYGVTFGAVVPAGRQVRIDAPRPLDAAASNPDDCVITSGSDRVEIRGDVPQQLLLLDVDGELVILRLAPAQDGPSAAEASDGGYLNPVDPFLLTTVHDLTFR